MQGLLRRKISIRRKARVADGQGGWTENWATVATERGRIRPATGREQVAGQREQAKISHVAYFRIGADVTENCQLVLGDLTVEVLGVRAVGGNRHHLEVDCMETQGGA